jgi:hypothetical protein
MYMWSGASEDAKNEIIRGIIRVFGELGYFHKLLK